MTMMDAGRAAGPVENAIYNLHGRLHIFVADHLVPVFGAVSDVRSTWNDGAELVATPGSELWVTKMVQFRNNLASDLRNANADVRQQKIFIENLGEALLAEADKRDWCGEYDEFAEQWGLPTRVREYDVIVRFRVLARSTEEAEDAFNLSVPDEYRGSYEPEVSIEECER